MVGGHGIPVVWIEGGIGTMAVAGGSNTTTLRVHRDSSGGP